MKSKLIAITGLLLGLLSQKATNAGHVHTYFLWPSNEIPVCFEEPRWGLFEVYYTKKQWKKWVKEGAQKWQEHSAINFTGWGDCQENSTGLRVAGVHYFSTHINEGKLGTELDGLKGGVQITSYFPNGKAKLLQIAGIKGTVIGQSIYKFGAALGILPEVARRDALPHFFCSKPGSYIGDLVMGSFDKKSVMYCNNPVNATGKKKLSEGDKRLVNFFYGESRNMQLNPIGFGNDADPTIQATNAFVGSWNLDKHIRLMADINGDGRADIVGFGDRDVFTALGKGNGTFAKAQKAVGGFGHQKGWNKVNHIRTLADVNGDGKDDIVAFGDAGVFTALSLGNGRFAKSRLAIKSYTLQSGGWNLQNHPRQLADINGDGRADIIGFGQNAVFTSLANSDGTFTRARKAVSSFTIGTGGWKQGIHFRQLGDINGDGLADIVGLSSTGIYRALSLGNGQFSQPKRVIAPNQFDEPYAVDFGDTLADVNGDGMLDIVDIGNKTVSTYIATGGGNFRVINQNKASFFSHNVGFITNQSHQMADVNGDGAADLVAISPDGIFASIANPANGEFGKVKKLFNGFSPIYGEWSPANLRLFTDLNGDGKDDVLGFGANKVYTAFLNE